MNERPEEYVTLPVQDPPELLRTAIACECGNPLWVEVISDDAIYLVIGDERQEDGLICLHFSGGCRKCGKRLEWHAPEQKLARLIRRRIERR